MVKRSPKIKDIGKWLRRLNKYWGVAVVIPTILGVGFDGGRRYEEWRLTKEHTLELMKEHDNRAKEQEEASRREFDYQQQILKMQAEINAQEYKIKIYETKFTK